MYIGKRNMDILRNPETMQLRAEYKRRFGKDFVPFSFEDFQGTDNTPAAELWREALRACLEVGKPYAIKSHAFEEFGH